MFRINIIIPLVLGVLMSASGWSAEGPRGAATGLVYINPDAPRLSTPVYKGERYTDTVPNTIDIARMAELCINGLTGPTDPASDYEIYFWAFFARNPPVVRHDFSDWCQIKFWEALPLLRLTCGSRLNSQVDDAWMNSVMQSIGSDGAYYMPLQGRPWWRSGVMWLDNGVYRPDGSQTGFNDPSVSQFTHPYACGRVINVMLAYYLRDHNPVWKQAIEKLIDRCLQLGVDKGDFMYFPPAAYLPGAKVPPDAPLPTGINGEENGGRLIEGPAKYYQVTGYKPALELARKLTNYLRYHSDYYGLDGSCLHEEKGFLDSHFHAHTIGLLGMLEYATAAHDRELVNYVRSGYEWFKTRGNSLVGFFPEATWLRDYPTCESCEVADMIALGLKLTEAGAGDYWDDVDRWVRNQFTENQLSPKMAEQIKRVASELPPNQTIKPEESSDHVVDKNIGAFAGWAAGNDWIGRDDYSIMHCCTGNAARSLYYVWEHMLNFKDGRLYVNLLMNRASRWADVYSYVPNQGRVDVAVKTGCKSVLVRMPEWVPGGATSVVCSVDGKPRGLEWKGRYVDLGPISPGDRFSVTFPVYEWTTRQTMGGKRYRLVVRGNTVVSIDPPGKKCPLYQREDYRQDRAGELKVNRFVTDERLAW